MREKYTYDAFISYRHTDLDKYVAENLHRMLETYRLPKNIQKKYHLSRAGIQRVFRDRDELPLASSLEDPIVEALESSEFLIVICSPRLKESMWCRREIETFIRLHGHRNILAVLVKGEPEDSFPEELLYTEKVVTREDGTEERVRTEVEPLAADVRGESKKQVKKAMKEELLRLLAPMFSLNYDDLRQRHKERRMKRIVYTSLAVAAGCFLFGVYSTGMAVRIHRQSEQLKSNQALRLAEESLERLGEDDRTEAVRAAYEALTEHQGIAMPYTAEAQYALTESLHLYDTGRVARASAQLETSDIVESMQVSPGGDRLLSCDKAGQVILWDLDKKKDVARYHSLDVAGERKYTYCFVGNDRIACINEKREVIVADASNGREITKVSIDGEEAVGISSDGEGKYLAVSTYHSVTAFDGNSLEKLSEYRSQERETIIDRLFFDEKAEILAFGEEKDGAGGTKKKICVRFMSLGEKKVVAAALLSARYLKEIRFGDGRAYILSGEKTKKDFRMTVSACSTKNGKLLWSENCPDEFGSGLYYAPGEGTLLACSSYTAHLFDEKSGKERADLSVGRETVGCFYLSSASRFLLMTESGEPLFINTRTGESDMLPDLYQLNCGGYQEMAVSKEGFLAIPRQDNRIVIYHTFMPEDGRDYNNTITKKEPMSEEERKKASEGLKLSEDSPVSGMVYNRDKTVLLVSYANGRLEIFDVAARRRIGKHTDMQDALSYYLGEDKQGNVYFAGDSCGYCFNTQYECIARIPGLLAVEKRGDTLVAGSEEKPVSIPIYSLEKLLEYAEKVLAAQEKRKG